MKEKLRKITQAYIEGAMSDKGEKKVNFSKLMFVLIFILTVVITIFSCAAMWELNNLDPLTYLIPAIFGECAVVSGFYSYKAKAENEIKLDIQRKLIEAALKEEIGEEDEPDGYCMPLEEEDKEDEL